MRAFHFWQKWLYVGSLLVAGFGLVMAVFNQSAVFDYLFNRQIDPVFWGGVVLPAPAQAFRGWIYGVLGATVTGWGVIQAFIARYPFQQRERWAWNGLALGLVIWFVVDTAISLAFQVYFNALFNTLLIVVIGLPLVFTRKNFNSLID